MELSKVLSRVNKLIALAEHEGTPPNEAAAAREQADRMMLDYAIEEAQLDAARPAAERMKPDHIDVPVGEYGEIIGHIAGLMNVIAQHCRCLVKHYTYTTLNEQGNYTYFSRVYGYTSDLKYFEILWTSVRLHALGVLAPSIDLSKSVDENAYRLHNAGFNWLDIAGMYGWRKVVNPGIVRREYEREIISEETYDKWLNNKAEIWYSAKEDEYRTNWQLGSGIKRAYHREVAKRGEKPTQLTAGGATTYRKSAARGYSSMIQQRLRRMRAEATGSGGSALVLRSDAVRDYFREENPSAYARCPRCQKLSSDPYTCEFCGQFIKDPPKACEACAKAKSGHCRAHPKGNSYRDMPFDHNGYAAGAEHARSADLMAGDRVSAPANRQIG
jgi:hypothetical protein